MRTSSSIKLNPVSSQKFSQHLKTKNLDEITKNDSYALHKPTVLYKQSIHAKRSTYDEALVKFELEVAPDFRPGTHLRRNQHIVPVIGPSGVLIEGIRFRLGPFQCLVLPRHRHHWNHTLQIDPSLRQFQIQFYKPKCTKWFPIAIGSYKEWKP